MKKYKMLILWADGSQVELGAVNTNDPKRVLFSKACELIIATSRFYDPKNPDNMWKGIKEGQMSKKFGREHYYYEANGNVLSIMEAR